MDKIKKYVQVTADFTTEGELRPKCITWEDGRRFLVDRITDCRRAASLKAGGTGLRFTCVISGSPHYLFYEENYRWFVESKKQ